MKIVTENSINAFYNNAKGKFGSNTEVVVQDNGATLLYLFGNLIAVNDNGKIKITDAGWDSNTTKERLNGLRGVHIQQKKGEWYLNGEKWNGNWKEIN
jgi:hypothetical protein